jgi:23S rRNA (guanine745-N1)-methyltransferase
VGRGEGALEAVSRCTALLACPVCGDALADAGRSLRCGSGHNFDRSQAGYIDLLPPGHGASGVRGDVRAMVVARRRFLERGYFIPIADAVNTLAAVRDRITVLDVGCGEGWYLGRLAASRGRDDECFLGCDVSRDALRAAARTHREATFFVNDVAHRISVADDAVDVLLNIFAPRNAAEFARVLRRDGLLVCVVPADDHLIELRERLPLLDVPAGKKEKTTALLAGLFSLVSAEEVRFSATLDGIDVRDLVMMGPSYWHVDAGSLVFEPARVTVAAHVLAFARV